MSRSEIAKLKGYLHILKTAAHVQTALWRSFIYFYSIILV